MKAVEEWLACHPLIKLKVIENILSMPVGTLRKGKTIPDKWVKQIEHLLSKYGYGYDVNQALPMTIPIEVTITKDKPVDITISGPFKVIDKVFKDARGSLYIRLGNNRYPYVPKEGQEYEVISEGK